MLLLLLLYKYDSFCADGNFISAVESFQVMIIIDFFIQAKVEDHDMLLCDSLNIINWVGKQLRCFGFFLFNFVIKAHVQRLGINFICPLFAGRLLFVIGFFVLFTHLGSNASLCCYS